MRYVFSLLGLLFLLPLACGKTDPGTPANATAPSTSPATTRSETAKQALEQKL